MKADTASLLFRCVLTATIFILLIYESVNNLLQTKSRRNFTLSSIALQRGSYTQNNLSKDYVVNTPFCKIPNYSAFDPTIRSFVRILEPAVCNENTSIVFQSGFYLKVNYTALQFMPYNSSFKHCTYRPIVRPKYLPTHNNFLQYKIESKPFKISIKVEHEFVRVNCYDEMNISIYINFHAFVQPDMMINTLFKHQHMKEDKRRQSLDVMMIGIDSVSRLSFIRQMVKTREFLRDNLAAFDMMGYNKVADNTFVNVVPMTLGKYIEEIPWDDSKAFDTFNFIWKQYSRKGYRTLYAEDQPSISIFDYLKKGFNFPPCDHFYRPLSLAMSKEKGQWNRHNTCFKDRLEAEIILNYTYDFTDTYKNNSHFSFTFLTANTHDYPNGASAVDALYYRFFKRLHDNDLIRNTVIFFFSDHGMRYGAVRETFIGKLEERLPFMYVIVPKWFRDTYPEISNLLRINQNRLSTPFDVYDTLQDILFLDGLLKPARVNSSGVSWFKEIPYNRSCETAGVLSHWCTCFQHEKLQTDATVVVSASIEVLNEIKKLLSGYDNICEELSIYQIKEASRIFESDEIVLGSRGNMNITNNQMALQRERKDSREDVQVVMETVPGNAHFEATLRVDFSGTGVRYRVIGGISRINLYGNQSACIDDFNLKKFCFCKQK